MHKLIALPALISLTVPPPVSVSVSVCGGGGEMGRGHYMLGNSCSCSPSKRRPNLCSYSYMRLSGSELVGVEGQSTKVLHLTPAGEMQYM